MEDKQKLTICGWMRESFQSNMDLTDVINIIYQYYMIQICSNILSSDESLSLLNLLFDTLKENEIYKDIKCIDVHLLFRANEHQFKAQKFHEHCDEKGPTLTIVHNENNHVYGGYCTESWVNGRYIEITDPTAFIYLIRPSTKVYKLREDRKEGKCAMLSDGDWGPEYGSGEDIWISDGCNVYDDSGCNSNPRTFDIDAKELIGPNKSSTNFHYQCKVIDYEVYGINTN